jgi:hypothetical protein
MVQGSRDSPKKKVAAITDNMIIDNNLFDLQINQSKGMR